MKNDIWNSPEDYDCVVRAEIANEEEEYELYDVGQAYNTLTLWKFEPRVSMYEAR